MNSFVYIYLPSFLKPTRTYVLLKPRAKKLNYIYFIIYSSRGKKKSYFNIGQQNRIVLISLYY